MCGDREPMRDHAQSCTATHSAATRPYRGLRMRVRVELQFIDDGVGIREDGGGWLARGGLVGP
jgi:hypothetical protein